MRLALYALPVGLALAWSILVWHVWSDNAYLGPYILGELVLLAGALAAVIAAERAHGVVLAIVTVAAAGAIAYALVGPLGVTRGVAEAFLAGGNGSQSPCLAEIRKSLPEEIRRGPPPPAGVPQIGPAEARESEIRGLAGGMVQSLVPFVAGSASLALAVRRSTRRAVLQALVPAGVVVIYLFVRGAAAWCGQLFGLDSLVLVVAGALVAVAPARFSPSTAAA